MPAQDPVKTCTACKLELPWTDFYKQSLATDRPRSQCKSCMSKANSAWRKANLARVRETRAKHRLANKDAYNAKNRAWKAKDREKKRLEKG